MKVPTEINGLSIDAGFMLRFFVPETKNRKSNFMLILCSVYAIMLASEIFEYLGSGLKVPTEINGFLLSIDALYQLKVPTEIFEYLGSGLKVPTEINGFHRTDFYSLSMLLSLCTRNEKSKI